MWNKIRQGKEEGFTLVELLVVVLIIGILAAIATPIYLNSQKEAIRSSLRTDVLQAAQTVGQIAINNEDQTALISDPTSKIALSADTQRITIFAHKKTSGYLDSGSYVYCIEGQVKSNVGEVMIFSYRTDTKALRDAVCYTTLTDYTSRTKVFEKTG